MEFDMSVSDRLKSLGIELPPPAAPVANYVPFVISGNIISISGQIPMGPDGLAFQGKVGADVSIEDAIKAARLCALNLIAQMNAATDGNLERVSRIVKLGGFVNCTDGFGDQPKVINAASDLMVDIFEDKGKHSRSAVGVNALPLNVPVEIDALVEISD
jgi:enamine deaminase RidA (YjgF/YER057c/UK114 family)